MTIAEQGDELMKLRKEEFRIIIEDNQLNVKREECVWDVLLKWVDIDPKNRKNDLLFLLPKVRFGLMDSKYFIENVNITCVNTYQSSGNTRFCQNNIDCLTTSCVRRKMFGN